MTNSLETKSLIEIACTSPEGSCIFFYPMYIIIYGEVEKLIRRYLLVLLGKDFSTLSL